MEGLTESQLLKSSAISLGEHEVHEDDFEAKPAAVEDQPPPLDVVETNGVDESREESSKAAPQLEVRNTTGTLGERPQFDQVCVCESIVTVLGQQLARYHDRNGLTQCCTPACMRR